MIQSRAPKIFYKFADNVRDATPNYDSSNEEMILWGLSKFYGSNRQAELLELATCLRQMLGGQFTDEELNRFYTASDANIKYSDPSLLRAFLDDAVVIVERELT
ncbi:hypothetical protein ASD04_04390 [Devosia sp. Root436]|jgi:hypothetical protein|uniref:hypothetical protein n=1 Tax=Devosia sp. Root436 TaxID=1736537 RepID=UPI0006FFFD7A|nr:hypothetical protein [Devosia sp. Root436]KQX39896.1 hypothetical protein ASD04_04390 [Devosia sp. Root436]